jgi:hypothetical protein
MDLTTLEYDDHHKFRVLKQITMLLRWFDECTTTTIGDAEYNFLVQRLMKDAVVPYKNSDLFFTNFHGKKNYKSFYITPEEQELFNQRIQNFMVLNNLSWDYYKTYIKE